MMRVPDFVPFSSLNFQQGNVGKLRRSGPNADIFGMGQAGPIDDVQAKLVAWIRSHALYLVAVGGAVGLIGSIPLKETPLEMTVTVAGGVILAAGLMPLILEMIA